MLNAPNRWSKRPIRFVVWRLLGCAEARVGCCLASGARLHRGYLTSVARFAKVTPYSWHPLPTSKGR